MYLYLHICTGWNELRSSVGQALAANPSPVPGSRPAVSNSCIVSPSHRPDITEIMLKKT